VKTQIENIIKYFETLNANFPNGYNVPTDEAKELLIQSWYEALKGYPVEVLNVAFSNVLLKSEYAPRLANIMNEIKALKEAAYGKSDQELWRELMKAAGEAEQPAYCLGFNYIEPNGKTQGENASDKLHEIFNNLDPLLQAYIHNTQGLIALTEQDDLEQYEKGRFMRAIQDLRDRCEIRKNLKQMPALDISGFKAIGEKP